MSDKPRFVSSCTIRSLWNEYRVYDDRVELDTLFGPWRIPFEQVEGVEVNEPILNAVMHGRFDYSHWPGQVIIDLADMYEHVTVDKSDGFARKIHFTPKDSEGFKVALEEALAEFRAHRAAGGKTA
jgi:hypothetical protein